MKRFSKEGSMSLAWGWRWLTIFVGLLFWGQIVSAQSFQLKDDGYFNAGGTDVMVFSDFYPEGHQGGVCVIMNGKRIDLSKLKFIVLEAIERIGSKTCNRAWDGKTRKALAIIKRAYTNGVHRLWNRYLD